MGSSFLTGDPFESKKRLARDLEDEDDDEQAYVSREPETASASSDNANSDFNTAFPEEIQLPEFDIPQSEKIEEQKKKIKQMTEKLNEALDLKGEITDVTDEEKWKKLFKHFEINIEDYIINGKLSIQLHIRYFLCCYIVAFIPADFIFFYPSFLIKIIPEDKIKIDFIAGAIKELKLFQEFVKSKASTSFLVTFYFGRKNTLIEDLKFIATIPNNLFSNPTSIIRELLGFELTSEGYAEYKEEKEKAASSWW